MVSRDRLTLSAGCTLKPRFCKDIECSRAFKLRLHRLVALERVFQVFILFAVVLGASGQNAVPALGTGQSFGILGEYYLQNYDLCRPGNGSFGVFDHLVPNITRKDASIYYPDRLDFKLKRCSWQRNVFNELKYTCAANDVASLNMAVRWTGYLYVITSGMYEFEMEVDDGARLTIGNGRCPGITCGDFVDTMNTDLKSEGMLETSTQGSVGVSTTYTYARQCQLCSTGVYGDCFVTSNGCEPFSAWTLEAEGATPDNLGACNSVGSARTYRGKKYMQAGQHPFKLEYFQRGGPATMVLRWKGGDTSDQWSVVSQYSFVFPKFTGLKAEWFELPPPEQGDVDYKLSRYFSAMGDVIGGTRVRYDDVEMQNLQPVRTLPGQSQTFSDQLQEQTSITVIRFLGWMRILAGGRYEFKLDSDDGSRLILGGQGSRKEQVVVDNDGLKERLLSAEGYADMLPGQHSIRLEFLFIPGYEGILPSPPGLIFQYKGPDTGGAWKDVQSVGSSALTSSNPDCGLSRWAWSPGSQYTSDCLGECFDTRQDFMGDGKCDGGPPSLNPVLKLTCSEWNNDNGDCSPETGARITTRTPGQQCYVSCPAGDWKRNSCARCTGSTLNGACVYSQESAPDCIPTPENPDKCNFRECCTAKLENIVGWGSDCIQYGAYTNCTHALQLLLNKRRSTPLPLYESALYVQPTAPDPPYLTGYVLQGQILPLINTITPDFILNPYTGLPTNERICPVGESSTPGFQCYDGPWELTGLQDPLTECQGGHYEDNFCVNRKTTTGLPYAMCCSLAWVNAQGGQECRMLGIPFGSCADYVKAYQQSVAVNSFTAISVPLVIFQCSGDKCNSAQTNVDAGNAGCPSVLNTAPWQTNLLRTRDPNAPLDSSLLYANGKASTPEKFNPTLVICIIAGVVALCIGGCVTYVAMQTPPPPTWHSEKAIVISDDTWIEPVMDQATGKEYGVVAPRTFAFLKAQEQEKARIIPKALRIDPYEVAVAPDAVAGAIQKQLRFEEDNRHCREHKFLPEEELRQAAFEEELKRKNRHPTHLKQQMKDREAVPAEWRDHSVPHLPQVVHMPDPFNDRSWELKDEDDEEDEEDELDDFGEDDSNPSKQGSKFSRMGTKQSKVSKASSKEKREGRRMSASKMPTDWRRGSNIIKAPIKFEQPETETESSIPETIADSVPDGVRHVVNTLEDHGFTRHAMKSKPPAAARAERKAKGKGMLGMICT